MGGGTGEWVIKGKLRSPWFSMCTAENCTTVGGQLAHLERSLKDCSRPPLSKYQFLSQLSYLTVSAQTLYAWDNTTGPATGRDRLATLPALRVRRNW